MSDTPSGDPIRYRYTFRFASGAEKRFEINLDPVTLAMVPPETPSRPDWTKLDYHQCEQCPLPDSAAYCPVAVNLAGLVETFKDTFSHEDVSLTVETAQRTYSKQTRDRKSVV